MEGLSDDADGILDFYHSQPSPKWVPGNAMSESKPLRRTFRLRPLSLTSGLDMDSDHQDSSSSAIQNKRSSLIFQSRFGNSEHSGGPGASYGSLSPLNGSFDRSSVSMDRLQSPVNEHSVGSFHENSQHRPKSRLRYSPQAPSRLSANSQSMRSSTPRAHSSSSSRSRDSQVWDEIDDVRQRLKKLNASPAERSDLSERFDPSRDSRDTWETSTPQSTHHQPSLSLDLNPPPLNHMSSNHSLVQTETDGIASELASELATSPERTPKGSPQLRGSLGGSVSNGDGSDYSREPGAHSQRHNNGAFAGTADYSHNRTYSLASNISIGTSNGTPSGVADSNHHRTYSLASNVSMPASNGASEHLTRTTAAERHLMQVISRAKNRKPDYSMVLLERCAADLTALYNQTDDLRQRDSMDRACLSLADFVLHHMESDTSHVANPSLGPRSRTFGTPANRSFGEPNRSFGEFNRSFGESNRSFGDSNRSFEPSNSFNGSPGMLRSSSVRSDLNRVNNRFSMSAFSSRRRPEDRTL